MLDSKNVSEKAEPYIQEKAKEKVMINLKERIYHLLKLETSLERFYIVQKAVNKMHLNEL